MSAPNLHVALAMAVDCQPSATDAALIERVHRLAADNRRLRAELVAARSGQLLLEEAA